MEMLFDERDMEASSECTPELVTALAAPSIAGLQANEVWALGKNGRPAIIIDPFHSGE